MNEEEYLLSTTSGRRESSCSLYPDVGFEELHCANIESLAPFELKTPRIPASQREWYCPIGYHKRSLWRKANELSHSE
jgi:hypothetical protein